MNSPTSTQNYRGASGEQVQILHGFTEQMGVNLTVEFHLDDASMVAANAASTADAANASSISFQPVNVANLNLSTPLRQEPIFPWG
jgi:hypothetical protein